MPPARLDVTRAGLTHCGDLDGPGTPRCALHVTLGSMHTTRRAAQRRLIALAQSLPARPRATVLGSATSSLPRMRTYLRLAFADEVLERVRHELGQTGPAHMTLSYRAEHAGLTPALTHIDFDALWLVDLADLNELAPDAPLNVASWRLLEARALA